MKNKILSLEATKKINGIFVLLVFWRHFGQYCEVDQFPILLPISILESGLRQLIVTPFLFFSAYGIYQRIEADGDKYISQLPKKRILKIWLHFAMAVTLFLLIGILQHQKYSLSRILLSYVGWESLGNSNWYIVAILSMYLATYVSFSIKCERKYSILLVFLLANTYVMMLLAFHKGVYWVNTIYSYPAGLLFAAYEEKFGGVFKKYKLICVCMLMVLTIGLYTRIQYVFYHNLLSVVFCLDIVLISTRLKRYKRNDFELLSFLGNFIFEIYILQRIPMILFWDVFVGYEYFVICIFVTVILALIFRKMAQKVDELFKL